VVYCIVVCLYCAAGRLTTPVQRFPAASAGDQIIRRCSWLDTLRYCRGIPSRSVRLDFLAPDLSFSQLSIVPEVAIESELGKGGFGIVWKGKLPDVMILLLLIYICLPAHVFHSTVMILYREPSLLSRSFK
jgi:hypothetical protein